MLCVFRSVDLSHAGQHQEAAVPAVESESAPRLLMSKGPYPADPAIGVGGRKVCGQSDGESRSLA